MRPLLAAIGTLSVIPLGKFNPTERDLERAANFFPVAGLLFALIAFPFSCLAARYFAPLAAAMTLALLPELFTKGFHLDGLADTADGFLSSRPRERKLEIMRDSHIGTMGVLAIVMLLGFKFALLASMNRPAMALALPLALLNGRCAVVWYIAVSSYARKDGMGAIWFRRKPVAGWVLGFLFACGIGFGCFGIPGAAACAAVLIFALAWSRITRTVIGGATGDTIGACEELAELLTLAALLALP